MTVRKRSEGPAKLTRRGFVKRVTALVAGAAAWVAGMPATALGAQLCVSPGSNVGCSSCHSGCTFHHLCSSLQKDGHKYYKNSTNWVRCCTDHGTDSCIGVHSCTGGKQWWMSYLGVNYCCGCL